MGMPRPSVIIKTLLVLPFLRYWYPTDSHDFLHNCEFRRGSNFLCPLAFATPTGKIEMDNS